jgi:hypothetical protein
MLAHALPFQDSPAEHEDVEGDAGAAAGADAGADAGGGADAAVTERQVKAPLLKPSAFPAA